MQPSAVRQASFPDVLLHRIGKDCPEVAGAGGDDHQVPDAVDEGDLAVLSQEPGAGRV